MHKLEHITNWTLFLKGSSNFEMRFQLQILLFLLQVLIGHNIVIFYETIIILWIALRSSTYWLVPPIHHVHVSFLNMAASNGARIGQPLMMIAGMPFLEQFAFDNQCNQERDGDSQKHKNSKVDPVFPSCYSRRCGISCWCCIEKKGYKIQELLMYWKTCGSCTKLHLCQNDNVHGDAIM